MPTLLGISDSQAHAGAYLFWEWRDAPGELRSLSDDGDEDLVCLLPFGVTDIPGWVLRAHCDTPSVTALPDGRIVLIWVHA